MSRLCFMFMWCHILVDINFHLLPSSPPAFHCLGGGGQDGLLHLNTGQYCWQQAGGWLTPAFTASLLCGQVPATVHHQAQNSRGRDPLSTLAADLEATGKSGQHEMIHVDWEFSALVWGGGWGHVV